MPQAKPGLPLSGMGWGLRQTGPAVVRHTEGRAAGDAQAKPGRGRAEPSVCRTTPGPDGARRMMGRAISGALCSRRPLCISRFLLYH